MTIAAHHLVIAGVTKAGTTALLHYLAQHPDVCGERRKEAQLPLRDDLDDAGLATAYEAQFRHRRDERWSVESSPACFPVGPTSLARLPDAVEEVRVVVTLRDPVTRLWSAYRMKRSKGLLPPDSYDAFVAHGLARRGSDEVDALHRVFATSAYASYLRTWFDEYGERCLPVFAEDLATDTATTVARIVDWLGLPTAPVATFDLSPHNRGVRHRSPRLHAAASAVNRQAAVVLRRVPRLRSGLLRAYEWANAAHHVDERSAATDDLIRDAYAAATDELRALLTTHGHDRVPAWVRTTATGPRSHGTMPTG